MFKPNSMDHGQASPWEYLPCTITPAVGMAMVMTGGTLVKCGATTKPQYISMASAVENGKLAVIRVQDQVIYETTASVALTAKEGEKVTLSSDGLEVTTTTTSGVAEIISMEDTTAGSKVRVRF